MYDTNKSEFIDTDVWVHGRLLVKDENTNRCYHAGIFHLTGKLKRTHFTVELVDAEKGIVYEQELTVTIPEAENGNENAVTRETTVKKKKSLIRKTVKVVVKATIPISNRFNLHQLYTAETLPWESNQQAPHVFL